MLLLSNNLKGKIEFPAKHIVRVNSAWVKNEKDLYKILEDNEKSDVFLDFPSGRTKPPKPTLTLMQLLQAIRLYKNIKYFAVSNSEDEEHLENIKHLIGDVQLVPKIETLRGIKNIDKIVKASKCKKIMLDKEDLYLDCKTDAKIYENSMGVLKDKCFEMGVKVLELKGVVFG
jgi:citrate lyase beta subunit